MERTFKHNRRQERLQQEERQARFVADLRARLHEDEDLELNQLLARIDALPKDDIQTDATATVHTPRQVGNRRRVLAVAASVVLLLVFGFMISFAPRPPKAVWLSMKHNIIRINAGTGSPAFEDYFLDLDQASIPLDEYPKGISRRLALRLSITGNAEGVLYYVEYRVQRPTKLDHGYDILSGEEILEMVSQGYIMGDVFVRP